MIGPLLAFLLTFSAVWGMVHYAPTRKDALLLHRVRASIVGLLTRKPGVTITDICREGNISWGTAQHHLYILQRAGLAASRPLGRTRVFFPAGMPEKDSQAAALLAQPRLQELAIVIRDEPGHLQKELCGRLGLTRKVFRHHIDLLIQAGLVVELAGAKFRRYEPGAAWRAAGPTAVDAPAVPVAPLAGPRASEAGAPRPPLRPT
ncbi:MAG: helix-turn-helix domain-containing protein [Euryarchaeota archaeon]|nr:helix-turn-helix domain-containing protein [Euryarchaeota archaeon]